MAKTQSLLQEARAFARDYPRDRMPPGSMWDLADYVPSLLDAQLVIRGGWKWASVVVAADIEAGIYAPFKKGAKLLQIDAAGNLYDVNQTTLAATLIPGGVRRTRQNPVMFMDFLVVPDYDGANAARIVRYDGTNFALSDMHTSALKGRYAAVFKGRVALANTVGQEERIQFSPPGFIDNVTAGNSGNPNLAPWDDKAYFQTSLPLTGIGALRSVILLFHEGSVERLRGSEPPSATSIGDMFLEPLYDRAGCGDAKSIAYWQDNCIFADERGIHFTDGAIVRNLAAQGGILTLWRTLYRDRLTVAADTFLDYYLITVIRTTGESITLVCDLQRRTWFRFTNIKAISYFHSIGAQEKLWAGRKDARRSIEVSNCFFPAFLQPMADEDGTTILPTIETPWYRLADEGRKRVRFVYVSYDARTTSDITAVAQSWRALPDQEEQVLEEIAHEQNGQVKAVLAQALEVGYITSPHEDTYTIAGRLPETTRYTRKRLPVEKNPYGIAFRIRQLIPTYTTRIFDIASQAQADERSRV